MSSKLNCHVACVSGICELEALKRQAITVPFAICDLRERQRSEQQQLSEKLSKIADGSSDIALREELKALKSKQDLEFLQLNKTVDLLFAKLHSLSTGDMGALAAAACNTCSKQDGYH